MKFKLAGSEYQDDVFKGWKRYRRKEEMSRGRRDLDIASSPSDKLPHFHHPEFPLFETFLQASWFSVKLIPDGPCGGCRS
jgi:hypothetical protein